MKEAWLHNDNDHFHETHRITYAGKTQALCLNPIASLKFFWTHITKRYNQKVHLWTICIRFNTICTRITISQKAQKSFHRTSLTDNSFKTRTARWISPRSGWDSWRHSKKQMKRENSLTVRIQLFKHCSWDMHNGM